MEFIGIILEYALKTDNLILIFLVVTCASLAYLVRWTLITSSAREERYISTIANLTEKFAVLQGIKEAVERIENQITR